MATLREVGQHERKNVRREHKPVMVSASELIGNRVIGVNGEVVGKVKNIYLSKTELKVAGVAVDKGSFAPELFLDAAYLKELRDGAVYLSISPVTELRGAKVFDVNGKLVGKVRQIQQVGNTNDIAHLVIDTGVLKKNLLARGHHVAHVGKNVHLNIPRSECPRLEED
ncbi:MAG: PRC-barrel domain-containing protein [Candidatus Aenigmarchaeota archaeon]|nr:PRC-barrel domain-containing protein [Candidatus Aenigmarchaeota archaeon]